MRCKTTLVNLVQRRDPTNPGAHTVLHTAALSEEQLLGTEAGQGVLAHLLAHPGGVLVLDGETGPWMDALAPVPPGGGRAEWEPRKGSNKL